MTSTIKLASSMCTAEPGQDYSRMFSWSTTAALAARVPGVMPNTAVLARGRRQGARSDSRQA